MEKTVGFIHQSEKQGQMHKTTQGQASICLLYDMKMSGNVCANEQWNIPQRINLLKKHSIFKPILDIIIQEWTELP